MSMGMFDSFYDTNGDEWQTKAFHRVLDRFVVGDAVPGCVLRDCQVEVLGGPEEKPSVDSYATIRDGRVAQVPAQRDRDLPLLGYGGALVTGEEGN